MSKMDDNHRHHPYYRSKNYNNDRRYNEDYKRHPKRNNKYHYQYSSSRRDNRNYNESSYRRTHKNDYHYQQSNSKSYTSFSTPPPPLMATIVPPLPPTPPPPPPQLLTVVPHERESWIRSVKKTKTNESTEQKTQYLETMLRMPQQQKSLLNSSRFDRMRFANDQLPLSTTAVATTNTDHLDNSSFHFIGDINNHDDIRTFEKILFDNELKQLQQKTLLESPDHEVLPTSPSSVPETELTLSTDSKLVVCSGFLIDNCDEEELPPLSPPPRPPLSSTDDFLQQNDEQNDEQRAMLVSELDAADAERKQALKRQKRLHKKLHKKKNENPQTISTETTDEQEILADWFSEYDINKTNQVSQLTDEVRRTSLTTTDEDKTAKVNLILMKIKKQQEELRKLRQYVMSILGDEHQPKSTKINRQNSNLAHDLLMAFLNQSTKSGCWLCSGKMYAEVSTQCDHIDEQ